MSPDPSSSGLITSKFLVKPRQVISATFNTAESYPGSWFSFWLVKKDVPEDDRYREVDIFEKFMTRKIDKQYTVTLHGGKTHEREMINYTYSLSPVNENNLTFTCELHQSKIRDFRLYKLSPV